MSLSNFLQPKRILILVLFVAFIIIDTNHDWKESMLPYDRAAHWLEWSVIALKCIILGVAVYRAKRWVSEETTV
jgi:hypothetical protein